MVKVCPLQQVHVCVAELQWTVSREKAKGLLLQERHRKKMLFTLRRFHARHILTATCNQ